MCWSVLLLPKVKTQTWVAWINMSSSFWKKVFDIRNIMNKGSFVSEAKFSTLGKTDEGQEIAIW